MLAAHPFLLLAEDGMVSVSGLAGKLWTLGDTFVRFDGPEQFRGWREPGYCKVAARHEVVASGAGSEIRSDVRIWCTDAARAGALPALLGVHRAVLALHRLRAAVRRGAEGGADLAGDVLSGRGRSRRS